MNTDIIIATAGIFLGELYGNMVGGGSLVTQAVLQSILHIDIKSAMAWDNFAIIGSNIGMLTVMIKKYKLKKWFWVFGIFSTLGAYIGAKLLVAIDPELLKTIFIIAIILLVIKNLFIKDKEHHEKGFKSGTKNYILLAIFGTFIGTYNAAFVIGDWIIALLILTSIFAVKYQEAVFAMAVCSIFSLGTAGYQYYQSGLLDPDFVIPMTTATLIGGIISAKVLDRIHSDHLEKFLKYLSAFLVAYLIWTLSN